MFFQGFTDNSVAHLFLFFATKNLDALDPTQNFTTKKLKKNKNQSNHEDG